VQSLICQLAVLKFRTLFSNVDIFIKYVINYVTRILFDIARIAKKMQIIGNFGNLCSP